MIFLTSLFIRHSSPGAGPTSHLLGGGGFKENLRPVSATPLWLVFNCRVSLPEQGGARGLGGAPPCSQLQPKCLGQGLAETASSYLETNQTDAPSLQNWPFCWLVGRRVREEPGSKRNSRTKGVLEVRPAL